MLEDENLDILSLSNSSNDLDNLANTSNEKPQVKTKEEEIERLKHLFIMSYLIKNNSKIKEYKKDYIKKKRKEDLNYVKHVCNNYLGVPDNNNKENISTTTPTTTTTTAI
jgi:hypothetical protein